MASEINVSVELARPNHDNRPQQATITSFSSKDKHQTQDQPITDNTEEQQKSFHRSKNYEKGYQGQENYEDSKYLVEEDEEKQKDFQQQPPPRSNNKNIISFGANNREQLFSSQKQQQQRYQFSKDDEEVSDEEQQQQYGFVQERRLGEETNLDEAQLNRYQQSVQTKRAAASTTQSSYPVSTTTTTTTKSYSAIQHRLGGSLKITPERIGVVIAGWPNELSIQCAKACVKRGYRMLPIGICMNDSEDDRVDITDVGTIVLYRYGDSQLRGKLIEQLSIAENKLDLFPVVIDTSVDVDNVRLYQTLRIPFVFETPADNLEVHQKAVRETRQMRCSAVIAQRMDKHVAAVDDLLNEMATRFPGLFAENFQQKQQQQQAKGHHRSGGGFDFSIKTSEGNEKVNRQVLDSMSDLFNKDVTLRDVQHVASSEQQERHHGMTSANRKEQQQHIRRTYELRASNRVGSSVFTIEQNVNATYECAEGLADSVSFLVQHVLDCPRPKVYGIEDVAQQGRFLTW